MARGAGPARTFDNWRVLTPLCLLLAHGACACGAEQGGAGQSRSEVQVPRVAGAQAGPALPRRASLGTLHAIDCLVPDYRARFPERWELHAMSALYLAAPSRQSARDLVVRKLPRLQASPELRLVDREGTHVRLITESMGILYLVYVPASDVSLRPPPVEGQGETIYLPNIETISGLVQADLAVGTYVYADPSGPVSEPVGVVLRESRVRVTRPVDAKLGRTKVSASINPWGYVELWVDSARLLPTAD